MVHVIVCVVQVNECTWATLGTPCDNWEKDAYTENIIFSTVWQIWKTEDYLDPDILITHIKF